MTVPPAGFEPATPRTVESHIVAPYRKLSASRKEATLREYRRLLELTQDERGRAPSEES